MNRILTLLLLLFAISTATYAQNGNGGEQMPSGSLTCFEYTTTYNRTGKDEWTSEAFKAELLKDGRVAVTCYDFYAKLDSITVYADQKVLDFITSVIAREMKRHSMRQDVNWLNGETGQGQTHHFRAEFSDGDTLRMNGYIANYGMKEIKKYLTEVKDECLRHAPMEEVKGPVPDADYWHAGGRFGTIGEIRRLYDAVNVRRYRVLNDQILVIRRKDGRLLDVWRHLKDGTRYEDVMQEGLVLLMSGIYENEKGQSQFGSVTLSREEIMEGKFHGGDPGPDVTFEYYDDYGRFVFRDYILWGSSRIKVRHDAPDDAPPGWGGHGAIAGSTRWHLVFTDNGLEVDELDVPQYCPTYPAFGQKFTLRKIRGPYGHTPDPWAVVSEEVMLRDYLQRLAPRQLNAMLAELKARHADGLPLRQLEKLNQELITAVIRQKQQKSK